MGRKRCIRARCGAVVVGLVALVSFLPAARAQSGIGEMLRALVSPPAAKLAPAELPGLPDGVDRGLPEAVDPALADDLRRVMTEPGRIPQLEIDVDGEKRALPLEHTHVSAELSGFVARVEVTQTYRNPLTEPIEAVYVFPLPENSAVDDMKIRIGERLIEAEIQRRAEARATYEAARREGYTAALLEQERPNVFTQSIANMEPGKEIEVVIRYVQDLSYDSGEYEFVFPMVVGPRFFPPGTPTGDKSGEGWARDTDAVPDASRVSPPIMGGGRRTGHDISVEVVLADGLDVQDFRVPTHEVKAAQVDDALVIELANGETIPNRDFVLRYAVGEDAPHGALYAHRDPKSGKGGFFSLVLQPPELDVDELLGRRELIFVIDVSGSMYGRPLAMAKDAARQAIRRLRPVDTFNVITFSGATAKAFPAPREGNTTNIREGLDFIEKARAGGGTMLANAVAEALKTDVADGRNRTVVFLTDGYVGNEREIHAMTSRFVKELAAKGQKARGVRVRSRLERQPAPARRHRQGRQGDHRVPHDARGSGRGRPEGLPHHRQAHLERRDDWLEGAEGRRHLPRRPARSAGEPADDHPRALRGSRRGDDRHHGARRRSQDADRGPGAPARAGGPKRCPGDPLGARSHRVAEPRLVGRAEPGGSSRPSRRSGWNTVW